MFLWYLFNIFALSPCLAAITLWTVSSWESGVSCHLFVFYPPGLEQAWYTVGTQRVWNELTMVDWLAERMVNGCTGNQSRGWEKEVPVPSRLVLLAPRCLLISRLCVLREAVEGRPHFPISHDLKGYSWSSADRAGTSHMNPKKWVQFLASYLGQRNNEGFLALCLGPIYPHTREQRDLLCPACTFSFNFWTFPLSHSSSPLFPSLVWV